MKIFTEGETVRVPCRHCASLTASVVVRVGADDIACAKCSRLTRVTIRRVAHDWRITTEAVKATVETQAGSRP